MTPEPVIVKSSSDIGIGIDEVTADIVTNASAGIYTAIYFIAQVSIDRHICNAVESIVENIREPRK